jgi:drug/metabolite transporter (DMT)-like permease
VISIGLFHVMWNMSVLLNGTAVATVLQYNAPFFVAIAAWLLWREPLTGRKIIAIVLAFGGTLLVSQFDLAAGSQITVQGGLVGLGTAVAFSGLALFGKKLSGKYHAWTILFYIFSFGALALLPFQVGRPLPWPIPLSAAAFFMGLVFVSTISGFAVYTMGIKNIQASIAVIVATVEVPFAAFYSYLFLGEKLDGQQIIGAFFVVSGVILLSLPRKSVGDYMSVSSTQ